MSDEVAGSAPVAVESAAPAADTGSAAESSATPATAPFDWKSWDGQADSVPEEHREVTRHVRRWYETDYDHRRSEIDDLRDVYTAMLNDDEDPRIARLGSDLEKLQKQLEGKGSEYSQLEGKYKNLADSASKEYVENFWRQHSDLREDKEKLAKFGTLLADENEFGGAWDGYIAAQLLDLPEEAVAEAVDAKKNGVSDAYALKLAQAKAALSVKEEAVEGTQTQVEEEIKEEVKKKVSKPRPAAKITNGATGSTRPEAAKRGMGEAKTLDEMRSLAASRALRLHSGGKR